VKTPTLVLPVDACAPDPDPGDELPVLGDILPVLGDMLPVLGDMLPVLGEVLPPVALPRSVPPPPHPISVAKAMAQARRFMLPSC